MEFYLMCGAPFSGKSTLARAIASYTDASYLGSDLIMTERGFDLSRLIPVEEWEKAHHIAMAQLEQSAAQGKNAVFDDTSFLRFLRDRFRHHAESLGYHVQVVYMETPLSVLEARRAHVRQHGGRTPLDDAPFYNVVDHMEVPTADETVIVFRHTDDIERWLATHLKA
jgi:predicted kinase